MARTNISMPRINLLTTQSITFSFSSSQRLTFGDVAKYTDKVTIVGCFRINSTVNYSNYPTIFSKGGNSGYFLIVNPSGQVSFNVFATSEKASGYTTRSLALGQWYWIVGTYDKDGGSNNHQIYIYDRFCQLVENKQATNTGAITGGLSSDVVIAQDPNRGYYMDISVSRAGIFNQALTQTEIEEFIKTGQCSYTGVAWLMNEGSGSTISSYIGSATGTLQNSPTWVSTSPLGSRSSVPVNTSSLLFNGTSDFIATSLWSTASTDISMGGWFKSTDYTRTRQPIISNGDGGGGADRGYALVMNGNLTTDGSIHILNHVVAWIDTGYNVSNNNWNHIMMTRDAAGLTKVYINATEIYSASPALGTPSTASFIGKDDGGGFFKGYLDDMRFYNKALTAKDVRAIYESTIADFSPTNWYKFNEGSGTTATDSGSAPKDGTITGATYSEVVPTNHPRARATGRSLTP